MTTTTQVAAPVEPTDPALEPLLESIAAGAAQRDRDRIHPHEQINAWRGAGLGAARIPVERGGFGWSFRDLLSWTMRLGEADPNVAHSLRNHYAFVEGRLREADPARGDRWVRAAVAGAIFSSAATENVARRVGSGEIETTLRPDGDGYRLNGAKFYGTGALYADWISTTGLVGDGSTATVLIPTDREGVIREDDWDGMGQRLTGTGTTRYDDVRVEADEILSVRAPGAARPPYQGHLSQLYLTSIVVGIIHNIVADSARLLHGRGDRTFAHGFADRPADDPLLHVTVGHLESAAYAARATVLAAADAMDVHHVRQTEESAHQASLEIAKAKIVIDQLGQQAASALFDVGGASATSQSKNLDRHWRNIRTLASHNPIAYKAQAIGAHTVNGTPLPTTSSFF